MFVYAICVELSRELIGNATADNKIGKLWSSQGKNKSLDLFINVKWTEVQQFISYFQMEICTNLHEFVKFSGSIPLFILIHLHLNTCHFIDWKLKHYLKSFQYFCNQNFNKRSAKHFVATRNPRKLLSWSSSRIKFQFHRVCLSHTLGSKSSTAPENISRAVTFGFH